jgi:hypothetical protein
VKAELRAEAFSRMLASLAEGFEEEDHIIDGTVEMMADDDLDDYAAAELAEAGPGIYREALAEHERDKATWPGQTDCDRLDAAFDELNARGILARHHWWCCQTCGRAAMPEERARAIALGRPARGYAFYHVQDTEAAADGRGIYLAYSSFEDRPKAEVAIAEEVVALLRAYDFVPEWDGKASSRVHVPMKWQRRARPARWTEE